MGRLTTSDVPKGTIPSGTLSPVKARILLMLALARGDGPAELAQVFVRTQTPRHARLNFSRTSNVSTMRLASGLTV